MNAVEPVARHHLRGDLHSHTHFSDGNASPREMALAARAQGLEYLAVTDHSDTLMPGRWLDADGVLCLAEEVARLNDELEGITLLTGVEAEILADGSLDLPLDVLRRVDVVVGSIHSGFDLPPERQTTRLLKALDHPALTFLAHPTGRLAGRFPDIGADIGRVIRHAATTGKFLELNSSPKRLDLNAERCAEAKAAGVLVTIDSDAHSPADFANLTGGAQEAARGGLAPADVLNTRPLAELRALLARTRA